MRALALLVALTSPALADPPLAPSPREDSERLDAERRALARTQPSSLPPTTTIERPAYARAGKIFLGVSAACAATSVGLFLANSDDNRIDGAAKILVLATAITAISGLSLYVSRHKTVQLSPTAAGSPGISLVLSL